MASIVHKIDTTQYPSLAGTTSWQILAFTHVRGIRAAGNAFTTALVDGSGVVYATTTVTVTGSTYALKPISVTASGLAPGAYYVVLSFLKGSGSNESFMMLRDWSLRVRELVPTTEAVVNSSTFLGQEGYRFGWNGMEKDDELKSVGNSYSFAYRMHDPRLGRFVSVDPLSAMFPYNSPYAFSENRVLNAIELEGLETYDVNQSTKGGETTNETSLVNPSNEKGGRINFLIENEDTQFSRESSQSFPHPQPSTTAFNDKVTSSKGVNNKDGTAIDFNSNNFESNADEIIGVIASMKGPTYGELVPLSVTNRTSKSVPLQDVSGNVIVNKSATVTRVVNSESTQIESIVIRSSTLTPAMQYLVKTLKENGYNVTHQVTGFETTYSGAAGMDSTGGGDDIYELIIKFTVNAIGTKSTVSRISIESPTLR